MKKKRMVVTFKLTRLSFNMINIYRTNYLLYCVKLQIILVSIVYVMSLLGL